MCVCLKSTDSSQRAMSSPKLSILWNEKEARERNQFFIHFQRLAFLPFGLFY